MAQYASVFDRIGEKQEEILKQSGQPYLDKAGKAAEKIKRMWGGHTEEDMVALANLKKLTPLDISTVKSVLEAVDYFVGKAREDPVLAREIVESSTDSEYRELMVEKRFDYMQDSIGALRAIDPYRMADAYLKMQGLSLGSSVHSIGMAWPKD